MHDKIKYCMGRGWVSKVFKIKFQLSYYWSETGLLPYALILIHPRLFLWPDESECKKPRWRWRHGKNLLADLLTAAPFCPKIKLNQKIISSVHLQIAMSMSSNNLTFKELKDAFELDWSSGSLFFLFFLRLFFFFSFSGEGSRTRSMYSIFLHVSWLDSPEKNWPFGVSFFTLSFWHNFGNAIWLSGLYILFYSLSRI